MHIIKGLLYSFRRLLLVLVDKKAFRCCYCRLFVGKEIKHKRDFFIKTEKIHNLVTNTWNGLFKVADFEYDVKIKPQPKWSSELDGHTNLSYLKIFFLALPEMSWLSFQRSWAKHFYLVIRRQINFLWVLN